MGPWLGLLNAYANAILHIFQFIKNHAASRVKSEFEVERDLTLQPA